MPVNAQSDSSSSLRTSLPPKLPSGLPPGLWIVATPIGNLSDLTDRARAALGAAATVLCEDTRRSSKLMAALGVNPRLERFDGHSSDGQVARWVESLQIAEAEGRGIALVTDAGTPAISDPGAKLVAAAREAGVTVTAVPGVSAVTTLFSVAGWELSGFAFLGFFPRKAGERRQALNWARRLSGHAASSWFESPERIVDTFELISEMLPEIRAVAAKELTKIHETVFEGTALEVFQAIKNEIETEGALGEWCFALNFSSQAEQAAEISLAEPAWRLALRCCLDAQVSASEAAKRVSQHFGVAKNEVYATALELSGKKTAGGG